MARRYAKSGCVSIRVQIASQDRSAEQTSRIHIFSGTGIDIQVPFVRLGVLAVGGMNGMRLKEHAS